MQVVVIGASGRTGSAVAQQALDAGHAVTAVGRESSSFPFDPHERLRTVRTDVLDAAALAPVVKGADAVVSALGPRESGPSEVCRRGAAAVVDAMYDVGVRRLAVVSASGAFHGPGDGPVTRAIAKPILQRVLRHSFEDTRAMEGVVRASGLDWTLVRPPRLLDKPRTGRYRHVIDAFVPGGIQIGRADVADYLLRSLDDPGTTGRWVGLGY
ncbi:SDR family oxidoreductase [Myceligenerans halotolerans]